MAAEPPAVEPAASEAAPTAPRKSERARRALGVATQDRRLDPTVLNVAPVLTGLPLATPWRRAQAMGVDLLCMALLSGVDGFWLVCGLALVVLLLRFRRQGMGKRQWVGWAFAGCLALLALQDAWDNFGPGRAAHKAAARAEAAAERKAEALGEAAESAVESEAVHLAAAVGDAASAAGLSDAQRMARLQAQIVELKKPRPFKWREQFDRVIDSVGVSFGWGVVYFSLLPAWWNGQTLGKKLLKLRTVELTGRPLTVMRCLRRYGGYAAGMATGGLGFLQAVWDVNRQGIQDRVAHTVVIDLRQPPLADGPAAPSPAQNA